jgi:hypothetical protein
VVPTYSFLQAALVLASIGRISDDAIHAVANDLRRNGRVPEAEIARQLDDAQRRLQVTEALCDRARPS